MKIVKILLSHSKNMNEEQIKSFLQKNLPSDTLQGLEHDDPKAIARTLKMLGINATIPTQLIEDDYIPDAHEHTDQHAVS